MLNKLQKLAYYSMGAFFLLIVTLRLLGVEGDNSSVEQYKEPQHEQWQMARMQVAVNQVNKYSPYTCNTWYTDKSFVSSYDNHTVHLVCDNWNRFEVATVAGVVKVEFKG